MDSTERTERNDDSGGMVKPNCTINERQNNLLDWLAQKDRYASRSEALRAAIESHHQTLNEDGEDHFERVVSQFRQISTKLEEIEEKLEEQHDHRSGSYSGRQVSLPPDGASNDVDTAVATETGQNSVSIEIEADVYSELSAETSKEVSSIATEIGESELAVRNALENLVDRGWVDTVDIETEAELAYRITE